MAAIADQAEAWVVDSLKPLQYLSELAVIIFCKSITVSVLGATDTSFRWKFIPLVLRCPAQLMGASKANQVKPLLL